MDDEIRQIAQENRDAWAGKSLVAIVETDGGFQVHRHTADGVAPTSTYPTAREAAARVLQLLHIGPVAPQAHPEEICIGTVGVTPAVDS